MNFVRQARRVPLGLTSLSRPVTCIPSKCFGPNLSNLTQPQTLRLFSTGSSGPVSGTTPGTDSKLSSTAAPDSEEAKMQKYYHDKIDEVVKENDVVIFMKGNPDAPMCGFSRSACKILSTFDIEYTAIDVLANEDIRAAIKRYSSWPTIPQIFVKGEFIGGHDILMEMFQKGELEQTLKSHGLLREIQSDQKKD